MMSLQIVHSIPGRLRIKSSNLQNNADILTRIKEIIASIDGVNEVHTSPITGSVLTIYDPERTGKDMMIKKILEVSGLKLASPTSRGIRSVEHVTPEEPYLTQATMDFIHSINNNILSLTRGYMGLGYLIPLFLFTYGTIKLVRQGPIPAVPWYLFYWWSFRTFIILNRQSMQ